MPKKQLKTTPKNLFRYIILIFKQFAKLTIHNYCTTVTVTINKKFGLLFSDTDQKNNYFLQESNFKNKVVKPMRFYDFTNLLIIFLLLVNMFFIRYKKVFPFKPLHIDKAK